MQVKAVAKLRALAKRRLGARAYWISGSSGTGKTTIARLIASEVAGSLARDEMNARDVDLAFFQEMERRLIRNCRAIGLLNGKPDSHYIARAERYLKTEKNNCRSLYQAAEAGYLTEADNDESD